MVSGSYLMHRRGCTVEMKIHYLHVLLLHHHLRNPKHVMFLYPQVIEKNEKQHHYPKGKEWRCALCKQKIISTKDYKQYINLSMLNSIERAICIDWNESPPSLVENRFTWLTRPLRLLQAARCWPLGRSSPPWLPREHLLFWWLLGHLAKHEPIVTRWLRLAESA